MSALTPIAHRIAPLVRLLASDQDGEVVAAARAIVRVLHVSGHDIHTLADIIEKTEASRPEPVRTAPKHWQTFAGDCPRFGGKGLKVKEREFLRSIQSWPNEPSSKQLAWLDAIAAALGLDREAA